MFASPSRGPRGRSTLAARHQVAAHLILGLAVGTILVPRLSRAATSLTPLAQDGAPSTNTDATPLRGHFTVGAAHSVGNMLMFEGVGDQPVRFESGTTRITARRMSYNIQKRSVHAEGDVLFEHTHLARQAAPLESRNIPRHSQAPYANVTDTLRGQTFDYDFTAQTGHLDQAEVHVSGFDLNAHEVIINEQRYIIHDVILRPGGLTAAERKIYGTPPFNLRAKTILITNSTTNNRRTARLSAIGAKLYYNNHALLAVPSYVLGNGRNLLHHERSAFAITPSVSFNSADGALLTTRLSFAPSLDPQRLSLNADIGASARVGFRGGLSLDGNTGVGSFTVRGIKNDIVTTQLQNRFALDRLPEAEFNSRLLPLIHLPGGQHAGISIGFAAGDYRERPLGAAGTTVHSPRTTANVLLTTRVENLNGPYLDLFARTSRYSNFGLNYRNRGFEVGYQGPLSRRIRGLFSYRSTAVSGLTPFRFDRVEIARELRTTFDIEIAPRYLVPIDVRYDLDLHQVRDRTFGLLRSYKTFAYGLVYQSAHRDLRLEVRSGF